MTHDVMRDSLAAVGMRVRANLFHRVCGVQLLAQSRKFDSAAMHIPRSAYPDAWLVVRAMHVKRR